MAAMSSADRNANFSAVPMDRLKVLQGVDDVQIASIRRGIIFVLAVWSGPSLQGFVRFTNVMTHFTSESVDLIIVDHDSLTQKLSRELFGRKFVPGGWGEAVWIREGHVVAREFVYKTPESLIAEHTRGLLEESQGK